MGGKESDHKRKRSDFFLEKKLEGACVWELRTNCLFYLSNKTNLFLSWRLILRHSFSSLISLSEYAILMLVSMLLYHFFRVNLSILCHIYIYRYFFHFSHSNEYRKFLAKKCFPYISQLWIESKAPACFLIIKNILFVSALIFSNSWHWHEYAVCLPELVNIWKWSITFSDAIVPLNIIWIVTLRIFERTFCDSSNTAIHHFKEPLY